MPAPIMPAPIHPVERRTAASFAALGVAPQGRDEVASQGRDKVARNGRDRPLPQGRDKAAPQGRDKAAPRARADNNVPVVPGIFFSWDADRARATIDVRPAPAEDAPGGGVRITGAIDGDPRWVSLNVELGRVAFAAGDTLCVLAEIEGHGAAAPQGRDEAAPQGRDEALPQGRDEALPQGRDEALPQGRDRPFPLRLVCRSFGPDGPRDTVLDDPLEIATGRRRAQAALHPLGPGDAATGPERAHTLIAFLPRRGFDLTLHDLRCAVVPDAPGRAPAGPTLARLSADA